MRAVLFGLVALLASATASEAAKRVALVIGNSSYVHTAPLKNPRRDAVAIAAVLRGLGFDVIEGLDLDHAQLRATISDFSTRIEAADVGVLFYAGHGLQAAGKNYLVPVDADLKRELDLQFQTIPLDLILRIMEAEKRINVVLLDACRDNPLADKLARSVETRNLGVGRGLARVGNVVGTYIGFATSPESVALDGEGDHSPFTEAILKHIHEPGVDIEIMMRRVRADVIESTGRRQVPWSNSSLTGGFAFNQSSDPATPPAPAQQQVLQSPQNTPSPDDRSSEERLYWDSVRNSRDTALLRSYLNRYPDGAYAEIARLTIQRLDREAQEKERDPVGESSTKSPDDKRSYTLHENHDSFGYDLRRLKGIDLNGCIEECRRNDDCRAFTYNKRYQVCFLKNGSNGLIPNGNATAGLFDLSVPKRLLTGFDNLDAPGNDIGNLNDTDLMTCYDICESDSVCSGFAYVYKNRSCWFKSRIGPGQSRNGVSLFVR